MSEYESLIKKLDLQPHPEGGFYRETYRAQDSIPKSALGDKFGGDRSHSTAIYFLLPAGGCSKLHRIPSDEVWHFYAGDSLTVVEITLRGELKCTKVGNKIDGGELPQYVVPAGHWFGAYVEEAAKFSLVGATVAPGFDFADFELAEQEALLKEFPQHEEWIRRLT